MPEYEYLELPDRVLRREVGTGTEGWVRMTQPEIDAAREKLF